MMVKAGAVDEGVAPADLALALVSACLFGGHGAGGWSAGVSSLFPSALAALFVGDLLLFFVWRVLGGSGGGGDGAAMRFAMLGLGCGCGGLCIRLGGLGALCFFLLGRGWLAAGSPRVVRVWSC